MKEAKGNVMEREWLFYKDWFVGLMQRGPQTTSLPDASFIMATNGIFQNANMCNVAEEPPRTFHQTSNSCGSDVADDLDDDEKPGTPA